MLANGSKFSLEIQLLQVFPVDTLRLLVKYPQCPLEW